MSSETDDPFVLKRERRSTIERFNEEMAVLDRPLANEVEYYDERPPRKASRLGKIAGAMLVLGGAGFLLWSKLSGAAAPPPLVVASAAPVAVAPVVTPMPTPVPAPVVEPPPAPPPSSAPLAMADAAPAEPTGVMPHASSSAAWSKIAQKSGQKGGATHARSKGNKGAQRGHRR